MTETSTGGDWIWRRVVDGGLSPTLPQDELLSVMQLLPRFDLESDAPTAAAHPVTVDGRTRWRVTCPIAPSTTSTGQTKSIGSPIARR